MLRISAAQAASIPQSRANRRRRGAATIDYFLLIAIVLPLAGFLLGIVPRIVQSVYDMITVTVAWPFM